MQEYKISADKLKELDYLVSNGYEVFEVNTFMGYAEIILNYFDDVRDQRTIILEAI